MGSSKIVSKFDLGINDQTFLGTQDDFLTIWMHTSQNFLENAKNLLKGRGLFVTSYEILSQLKHWCCPNNSASTLPTLILIHLYTQCSEQNP
jgi:hypothetical protein